MAEQVLLKENNLEVTTTSVKGNGNTLAVRNITSVSFVDWYIQMRTVYVGLRWFLRIVAGLLALFILLNTVDRGLQKPLAFIFLVVATGAIFWFTEYWMPRRAVHGPTRYKCYVTLSGQPCEVVASGDAKFIERVVAAINKAIEKAEF